MTEEAPANPTLLVCEDDADIRDLLTVFLERQGFVVHSAGDSAALDRLLEVTQAHLVILDWMLPSEDGLSICGRLQARGGPPVLMLTARDGDPDRIAALETGADAYIAKPFNADVLLAQIRALLRKAMPPATRRLLVADLVLDPELRRVTCRGVALPLTGGDFDLLHCFLTRPQRVLSRDDLMAITRGRSSGPLDRTIDVQVSRLRAKLVAAGSEAAEAIRAVRHVGYILSARVLPDTAG